MATRNMTDKERAIIIEAQMDFERAKARIANAGKKMQRLYEGFKERDEPEFAAEAFRVKSKCSDGFAAVEGAHSAGTDALLGCFEDAGPVLFGGGGR